MESPPVYEKKTLLGMVKNFARSVKKASWSVLRCFIPRINVGIGINLWRFNA